MTLRHMIVALLLFGMTFCGHAARRSSLCEQSKLDIYPDVFYSCEAMQNFKKGFDKQALFLFKHAARWGSKQSQYKIGLMYVGGFGTEPNPVEGAAWLLLANERNVMHSTEQLALVMSELSGTERAAAKGRAQFLRTEFGDVQALTRRARWVRQMKRRSTGSHLGRAMATVSIPGGEGLTTRDNINGLTLYESNLRETLTTVEYRDFKVLDPQNMGSTDASQEQSIDGG
jgi:TPR repeat protein